MFTNYTFKLQHFPVSLLLTFVSQQAVMISKYVTTSNILSLFMLATPSEHYQLLNKTLQHEISVIFKMLQLINPLTANVDYCCHVRGI
jgi:hypothetical protein